MHLNSCLVLVCVHVLVINFELPMYLNPGTIFFKKKMIEVYNQLLIKIALGDLGWKSCMHKYL